MVANGTYVDISCRPELWGPLMFANYRNCLWSCNWLPVTGAVNNRLAAERFGLPQGLSNGWGDSCGPHEMPPELLDRLLQRFTRNVERGRLRVRCLNDLDNSGIYDQRSDSAPMLAPRHASAIHVEMIASPLRNPGIHKPTRLSRKDTCYPRVG